MNSPLGSGHIVCKKIGWCFLAVIFASCSQVVYQPAPVIPTTSPLSYSSKVKLTHVEAYIVEPGSTMIADPRIENHVSEISAPPGLARKEWEKSVADYLAARKTFTYLSADSQTDLDLAMRLNIYIDPGIMFQFNYVYLARADASLIDPRTGRTLTYLGVGKSTGEVSRGGTEDDQLPVNLAVQAALNDLFGKIESDSRLRRRR